MKDVKGEKNPNYRHGKKNTRLYNIWMNMKQRCSNKNHPKYKNYGAKGISVCDEWLNMINFYNWAMDNGYNNNLTIDRIDLNGNYEPNNCQWISLSENSRKKTTTKIDIIKAQEIRSRISEKWSDLAKEYIVCESTIYFIMKNFTHI